jgi:hypothetical protein
LNWLKRLPNELIWKKLVKSTVASGLHSMSLALRLLVSQQKLRVMADHSSHSSTRKRMMSMRCTRDSSTRDLKTVTILETLMLNSNSMKSLFSLTCPVSKNF